jgi:hypothetical protein
MPSIGLDTATNCVVELANLTEPSNSLLGKTWHFGGGVRRSEPVRIKQVSTCPESGHRSRRLPISSTSWEEMGEYGGHQRRRTSSITDGRGTSCDHNVHVVSYLAKVHMLCSTPAASIRFGRAAVESIALSEPLSSGRVEGLRGLTHGKPMP